MRGDQIYYEQHYSTTPSHYNFCMDKLQTFLTTTFDNKAANSPSMQLLRTKLQALYDKITNNFLFIIPIPQTMPNTSICNPQ